ncbi:putative O-methyltransferase [Flammeovirgaceae bacterium 311]|nr:putative O-methyltransferase [Flammeovirgaceae bacterium 311]
MFKKLFNKFFNSAVDNSSKKDISYIFSLGLPTQMKPVLAFLINGEIDDQAKAVAVLAETRRNEIAKGGDKKVPIWYSPKPSSAGSDTSAGARPQPGEVLEFTMERVAATGKNQKWATALYLIAREFKSSIGIELGTCAGISSLYISSAPSMDKFITVEGSEALANIAKESLKSHKNVKVVNALFDDALHQELPSLNKKIDLAYIDGHHEKIATIHYLNKLIPFLSPGAVVLFDDISWSYDMRDAWDILSKRKEFSHAMDLGAVGLCILKSKDEKLNNAPMYWDLQPYVGKHKLGDPHGWKE